jgi:hypothetical protein
MKKTYIIPSLEVIRMQTFQILAASKIDFGESVLDASDADAPELYLEY